MPSVSFTIDFGEPDGKLEDFGLEDCTSAEDVIRELRKAGHRVSEALEEWDLLRWGEVTVTYTPDLPPELMAAEEQTELAIGDRATRTQRAYQWVRQNETTATWSDWEDARAARAEYEASRSE